MDSESFALCINCEEMVDLAETVCHSQKCSYVLPEVLFGSLQHTRIALQKLALFLESLGSSSDASRLLQVARRLQSAQSPEEIKSFSRELLAENATVACPIVLVIARERLKTLSRDLHLHACQLQAQSRKAEIDMLRQEIEHYKREAESYREKLAGSSRILTAIEDIDSRQSSPEASLNASMDEMGEPLKVADGAESLKQYFYLQCLTTKLTLKPTHRVRKVAVESLYREAVDRHLAVEDWPEFIRARLQDSQRSRRSSLSRFAPESVIREETD